MTLLREITEQPLDPGYADMARRKQHGGGGRRLPWLSSALVFVLAIALGAMITTAAVTLRSPGSVRNQTRELLTSQIEQRQELQERLIAQNAAITNEINALTDELHIDSALARRLERLGVVAGVTPVVGEAYVITLADSARASAEPTTYALERVQAGDLLAVVNEMWAGGAEAVAINGVRVGATGAVRGAGAAILADLVPVTSPYEIVAIGPASQIRSHVAASGLSTQLGILRDRYHLGVSSAIRDEVWVPGVRSTQLRFAEPFVADAGAPEEAS